MLNFPGNYGLGNDKFSRVQWTFIGHKELKELLKKKKGKNKHRKSLV